MVPQTKSQFLTFCCPLAFWLPDQGRHGLRFLGPGLGCTCSLTNLVIAQDEELAAQGVQVLREDILDKTVKLNIEYKVGNDSFVSVHIDKEDVGKNLVEDGLLLVERQRGRKLEKLVKVYEEAMGNAKKNHLNIWRYGDITQDDSREFGAPAPKPQR